MGDILGWKKFIGVSPRISCLPLHTVYSPKTGFGSNNKRGSCGEGRAPVT